MSSYWTFYSFDSDRFQREARDPSTGITNLQVWLESREKTTPDSQLLAPDSLEMLGNFDLDYNLLPRKHWKILDAYYRLYLRELLDITPESIRPSAHDNWRELLRFYHGRNGRDTETFAALAGAGSRIGLLPRPEGWVEKLTMAMYGAPCNYLILEGEALHTFCRHLQALFYVNSWDWPTYMEEQEVLRPHFVDPFLNVRDGSGALFAYRSVAGEALALRKAKAFGEVPI